MWLAWPAHTALWGDDLGQVQTLVTKLAWSLGEPKGGETIELLVHDALSAEQAGSALQGLSYRLHPAPYGDLWLRDTAPLFLRKGEELSALAFAFNGWGRKYELPGDTEVAQAVAAAAGVPLRRSAMVLEGGALEGDGEGSVITTRQCVLNPNRNPSLDATQVEAELARSMGARQVIWLEQGLQGDHTDGHVDNLARFVGPGRVLCGRPSSGDPNEAVLQANLARLCQATDAEGRRLRVETLPMPLPRREIGGEARPASHLNFLIGNRVVVVPIFGGDSDQEALDQLRRCFPEREVVGLDCQALLRGGGAIHCISQQEPLGRVP